MANPDWVALIPIFLYKLTLRRRGAPTPEKEDLTLTRKWNEFSMAPLTLPDIGSGHKQKGVVMGISDRTKRFEEAKTKASIVLKDLRSASPERNASAAARFQKIVLFSNLSVEEIVAARDTVRRKHALAVIAAESGFSSWTALKDHCHPEHPDVPTVFDCASFFGGPRGAFLNRWFKDYGQARSSLAHYGGYLFSYRDQYFICESGFIEALGLNPEDPDWQKIGWNCVEPADAAAWERLLTKLQIV
jgi:hypothetical protein